MSAAGEEDVSMGSGGKRRWIKYYCEECKAWESREMFEVAKELAQSSPSPSPSSPSPAGKDSTLWSWGCSKLVHRATLQTFRVDQLNSADGHDAAPKLAFPSTESPAATEPVGEQPACPGSTEIAEEVSALQTVHTAQSNGSSQTKRQKRTVRSTYARDSVPGASSPIHSQRGVSSSSSPNELVPDENGASTVHVKESPKDGEVAAAAAAATSSSIPESPAAAAAAAADTSIPESPAVIDAEHHENGMHKRPRRLTAGDRGLAQALQFEKPSRATTKPLAEVNDVKPSQSALADMKRPKRVTAGLRGLMLSAENAKPAPTRALVKKEQKKDAVHEVRTRCETAKRPSKKNRKLGDLY